MTNDNQAVTSDVSTRQSDGNPPLSVDEIQSLAERITENVETVIIGKRESIEEILIAMFARGHVLLEDVPGTGKTMLARALARSVDGIFKRVQFTPDLLPSDITGVNVYNQQRQEFDFTHGPVFAHVVLGDEINRAPPKTQSALLEAMEEGQVTVDGTTRELPDPFMVIATQNMVEPGRTYELPLAEIDRFMKQLALGYPDGHEAEMLERVVGEHPIKRVEPVATIDELRAARATVAQIDIRPFVLEYAAALSQYTRNNATLGVSPRGSIALVRAAQARAAISGREYVIPDDLQREAPSVLTHRITIAGDREGVAAADIVSGALEDVHVP